MSLSSDTGNVAAPANNAGAAIFTEAETNPLYR
jgi:hypothetical protein